MRSVRKAFGALFSITLVTTFFTAVVLTAAPVAVSAQAIVPEPYDYYRECPVLTITGDPERTALVKREFELQGWDPRKIKTFFGGLDEPWIIIAINSQRFVCNLQLRGRDREELGENKIRIIWGIVQRFSRGRLTPRQLDELRQDPRLDVGEI